MLSTERCCKIGDDKMVMFIPLSLQRMYSAKSFFSSPQEVYNLTIFDKRILQLKLANFVALNV